ncbi:zinc finger E-box-binding homeobox 1-like [Hemibagrus wyckioides]|uniref:zinc finger E-box-binding homeobox 1-like n=1 Tax=Hemibagrus wyckioides TaxID=337641 RepID=UPI00266DBDFF|nr:zinc finger E-box-binding homeobox 1-like [Hemibagrus wyckioides]
MRSSHSPESSVACSFLTAPADVAEAFSGFSLKAWVKLRASAKPQHDHSVGTLQLSAPAFLTLNSHDSSTSGVSRAELPKDPEDEAEEDDDGSREHEEVPEAERRKDAEQEQDETGHVQDDGQEEEAEAASDVRGAVHGSGARRSQCGLQSEDATHSCTGLTSLTATLL